MQIQAVAIIAVLLFVLAPIIIFTAVVLVVRPWLRALFYLTPVPPLQLLEMLMRGKRVSLLVDAYIALKWARVPVTINEVECIYTANRQHIETSSDLVELMKQSTLEANGRSSTTINVVTCAASSPPTLGRVTIKS